VVGDGDGDVVGSAVRQRRPRTLRIIRTFIVRLMCVCVVGGSMML